MIFPIVYFYLLPSMYEKSIFLHLSKYMLEAKRRINILYIFKESCFEPRKQGTKKSGWEQKKGGSKKTTLGLDTVASKVSILGVAVPWGVQGYSDRSGVTIKDLCHVPLFEDYFAMKIINMVKVHTVFPH